MINTGQVCGFLSLIHFWVIPMVKIMQLRLTHSGEDNGYGEAHDG